jgi:hypothetical protein
MASQAFWASANVLKGNPPTLMAVLLKFIGAKKLQSQEARETQHHL